MARAAPGIGKKTDGSAQRDRDAKGRFVKGNRSSGGRKPLPEDVKEMCVRLTPQAIETAAKIMLDEDARSADRLKAAEIILDRGYGKPAQSVAVKADEGTRFVFVGMDDVSP